jgi:hypothetical protein
MCPLEIPSRRVLDETPRRVFTMLQAVGTMVSINEALVAEGFSQAEQDHAWGLLHNICNYHKDSAASPIDSRVRNAIVELDAWDEPNLARISATVGRLHPDQYDAMMRNLEATTGVAAVLVVERTLDRLDELEKSTDEKQRAVVATLAARGYDTKERKRLRDLVTVAKSAPTLPVVGADPDEVRLQDLLALYRWYRDWSETARAVITRRDYLIRLGLATRRQPATEADAPQPQPAPLPAPLPTPPTANQ